MSERRRDHDTSSQSSAGGDTSGGDNWNDNLATITSILVLALGIGPLLGFVLGSLLVTFTLFAAGLILLAIVLGSQSKEPNTKIETTRVPPESEGRSPGVKRTAEPEHSVSDSLNRLRDRYARGDLSDEQFERKLEVLLDTQTPEDARERIRRRQRERESTETET
ncbi:SHOCT domain-containing protein [Halogeometricum borinquense]|uniref:SHOCT domain-containing protein n=1 Tax=Halogeometricum borinquense TaxID=60847 RepID=UPI00343B78F1